MSQHLLEVYYAGQFVDAEGRLLHGPIHPDQHVFPERTDDHGYRIICTEPDKCTGWQECPETHAHDGVESLCGPEACECDEGEPDCVTGRPWESQEDFEFHGTMHTWQNGWGWTVPYEGCVVADNGWTEPPEGWRERPIGCHELEVDWDGDECYLEFSDPAEEPRQCDEPDVRMASPRCRTLIAQHHAH
ncbi:MAG: hypothetical protein WAV90_13850 [Gordonia amarae]